MDGYLGTIETLDNRLSQTQDSLTIESVELYLSLLKAGQIKMAEIILEHSAPGEVLNIYRALGCYISENIPE
jgi:hypothetical protein